MTKAEKNVKLEIIAQQKTKEKKLKLQRRRAKEKRAKEARKINRG